MTNDMDDMEHHDLGHEPDNFSNPGLKANLANAWRTQPMVKLLVLMVVVVAIAAVSFSLFSDNKPEHTSATTVNKPPIINEPPGGAASPYVQEQTQLATKNREMEAEKNHGSSMPTPLGTDNSAKDDPLKELKTEIENLSHEVNKPKDIPQAAAAQPVQTAPPQPEVFDESLAKAMQKQMGDLTSSWGAKGVKQVTVTKTQQEGDLAATDSVTHSSTVKAPAVSEANAEALNKARTASKIIIPAGTVSYAKLLTQANSDVPGPILAEIVSGPLNGARAVGMFETINNYSDYLVLRFNLAELNGKEYQINTLALDPDTSLGGMATDVDQRYFDRVILPAAASFMTAFGGALSNNGSNTSTNGQTTITTQAKNGFQQGYFAGAAQAGQTVGQFFQNQANNTKPLVVVAAGTPMGLMFVTSVKSAPDTQPTTTFGGQQQQAPTGLAGYSSQGGFANSNQGSGFGGLGGLAGMGGNSNVPYPTSSMGGYGAGFSNPMLQGAPNGNLGYGTGYGTNYGR